MAQIELRNVSKSFQGTEVIRDVSLIVQDREFCVFVGPSGCGKSTLLRLIAGLESVTTGQILIDGQDVTGREPHDRHLSMVFQSYALYPHMTVRQNIAFALETARMPKDQIAAKVTEAARMLRLEGLLDRRPAQLSGGQRQRVAIGRAIVRQPKAFLFDEPLSNLDTALRADTRIEIASLHRTLGATMIYVTHDQVEAMTLADRIVVLNAGRVEQSGTPMELYNTPATEFVATFLGSPTMNILRGPAADPYGAETIGLRPEDLVIVSEDGDWSGTVRHIEQLGSDTILHLDMADSAKITVRVAGQIHSQTGDTLGLRFDRAKLHRFRAGQRV
ncbi:MAG: ATP-binding cassette domain-containing protein [Rhodobacterales bacterium]|nr:ATP-binding cassette domain-containing protein [Rhodobacterales bacterium]